MSSTATAQQGAQISSFRVGETYKIVDVVGEGAYGVVW